MPTITILMGPPCSGKTTYANELLEGQSSIVRVGRDQLRYMLQNRGICSASMEVLITKIQERLIENLLEEGYDIIVDNTHCSYKYIKEISAKFGIKNKLTVVTFNTPKWKLKFRNIIRYLRAGIWIPMFVIDKMYSNFEKAKQEVLKDTSIKLTTD